MSIHVGESDLTKADKAKFAKGDIVKLSSPKVKEDGNTYQGQLATVEKVKTHHAPSSGGYQYDMTLNDGQHLDGIPEKAIVVPYRIALKEENTAQLKIINFSEKLLRMLKLILTVFWLFQKDNFGLVP